MSVIKSCCNRLEVRFITMIAAIIFSGCAARRSVPVMPPAPSGSSFIDLQPGWRIRVVTPILKSGKYELQSLKTTQVPGRSIALSAGDDFIGYEISYYAVAGSHRSALRLRFTSARAVRNGKNIAEFAPLLRLLILPDTSAMPVCSFSYAVAKPTTTWQCSVLTTRIPWQE